MINDYIVTQKDIEIAMQTNKVLSYKLELLNKDLKILDSIEGNLIEDNISIDSDSDIRRTYSCTLIVTDSSFTIGQDKRIWFDKLIRPKIGILHQRTQEIIWYTIGLFIFVDTNFTYNATTKQLTLTCNDQMCMLNGVRGGELDGYTRTITEGTDARTVIINLLAEIGITQYFIEFNLNDEVVSTFEIPYDLVYQSGVTAYTIIHDIVSLYPGTQMYFSKDGFFIITKIPTGENEQNILNDEILQPLLIDEQLTTSFSPIFNYIQIYGKVNSPQYYTKDVTLSGNTYNCNVIETKLEDGVYSDVLYDSYDNFDEFGILIPVTNPENIMININSLGAIPVVNDKGQSLKAGYLNANTDCVFKYRRVSNDDGTTTESFLYIGQYQATATAYLTNNESDKSESAVISPDSDYTVEVIGKRLKVLSGGDYDLIYTDSLCFDRARYELFNATSRQDTMTLNIAAIPWIDVNQKIEFTTNNTNETYEYLINSISCNYAEFQMTLGLSRYYHEYINS